MHDDDEVMKEFLVESHEGLDQLDREFVALEADPSARERITIVFRTIHTIKGTSGFLGLSKLESLTHVGENLLVQLRDGKMSLTPAITTTLLALVDRVRLILRHIEAGEGEGAESDDDLKAALADHAAGKTPAKESVAPAKAATPPPAEKPAPAEIPVEEAVAAPAAKEEVPPAPAAVAAAAPKPAAPAPAAAPAADTGSALSDSNVRVDIGLLDKLMNLVGELVLARNQMIQVGARIEDATFISATQRLDLVTTELQENVMKTRMQPIGNVWSKLPRVVRDLAVACGKQIRVEMYGKETDLDRTVLEAIKDPLTHIVRNSADHGLETPDVRAAKGKPKTGTLTLRAYHEGGQVIIEISDDGKGLDLDAIRKKAIERNLITPERAAALKDYEIAQLIFLPGLSTAEKVTNVSGRGVGMDVVKSNIERISGTIDLVSRPGAGTTLKIRIPLTLAIVPALVVVSNGYRYAIPQTNLLELVRLEGDTARDAIESVRGAPVYRLRGQLLPLVYLNKALQLEIAGNEAVNADANIIVLQANDRQLGLIVDEVRDTEEIVVKPLGKELKNISVFAGATIMGDGRVALILDVVGLAQHAGAISLTHDQNETTKTRNKVAASHHEENAGSKQTLLLFGIGNGNSMAIPLDMVSRLEEFQQSRFERAGSATVMQYRGAILPLIDLRDPASASTEDTVPVLVYSEGEHSVGFVVSRILDVVEDIVRLEQCTSESGVLGAAVIHGGVTDMLDVDGILRERAPWFQRGAAA